MPTYSKEEIRAALLDATTGEKIDGYAGQRLVLNGFSLAKGGFGEYAIISAVTEAGDEVTITNGGMVVLPQLKKLEEMDAFPIEVEVIAFPGQFGKTGHKFEVVE